MLNKTISKAYLFQLLAQEYLDSLNKNAQRYWFKNQSTLLKGKIPITPLQKSEFCIFDDETFQHFKREFNHAEDRKEKL